VSGRARTWVVVIGAIVALNAALYVVERLTPEPGGPDSSSYATSPRGLAAWASLLERGGTPVRRVRGPITGAAVGGARTVVALDAENVVPSEVRALERHLAAGGTVVAGGSPPPGWVTDLVGGRRLGWRPDGVRGARVLAPAPETAGVTAVATAAGGAWTRPGPLRAVLGAPGRAVILAGPAGRGRVVLLADPSPVQNRLLGVADNAQLALSLAGRGPVAFAEGPHGYGRSTGLAAIPGRWKLALGLLLLAALAFLLSRARRLGPPQDAGRVLPPPRIDFVDSVAVALRRTHDRDGASAPVAAAARAELARHEHRREELDAGELAATEGEASDDDAVLARGRALAKLTRGGP
jgi:hypothetical protein